MTDSLDIRPAFRATMPADKLASVLKEFHKIASNHVGAGSFGFRNLSFELIRKPEIVVVKKGDPFTFGVLDAEIAGDGSVSIGEREISSIISGGAVTARPAYVISFPIGNGQDLVIRDGVSSHSGTDFRARSRVVVSGHE